MSATERMVDWKGDCYGGRGESNPIGADFQDGQEKMYLQNCNNIGIFVCNGFPISWGDVLSVLNW